MFCYSKLIFCLTVGSLKHFLVAATKLTNPLHTSNVRFAVYFFPRNTVLFNIFFGVLRTEKYQLRQSTPSVVSLHDVNSNFVGKKVLDVLAKQGRRSYHNNAHCF